MHVRRGNASGGTLLVIAQHACNGIHHTCTMLTNTDNAGTGQN